MTYREEKLAAAMAEARDMAEDPTIDSVYLAGSLTAGLGSPTSDVDVFVLAEAAQSGLARQLRVGNERLDIETYSIAWVDEALAKLSRWESSRQKLRFNALSEEELDFLIRMRDIEVVKSSPHLRRLRKALADATDRLRQMTLSTWALRANGHLSDFKGAVQDGDLESAGLICQSLLASAAKSVTTAAGDLYFGAKWVHRQLRRSLADSFPHDLFQTWQSGAWARESGADAIRDVMFFQQTLVAAGQLLGWHGTSVSEWPFWETGKGTYRRNPSYNTIHLTEGVLLNNELQRQLVVKADVALVWALSNGREEDEIVSAAVELAPKVAAPGDEPTDADRVREVLALLHRRGLVSGDLFR